MKPLSSATDRRAMRSLPIAFRRAIGVFAPGFSRPVWPPVTGRLTGAVLAPGQRTVTTLLRRRGRRAEPTAQTDQRGRQRAVWSPLPARRRHRLGGAVCVPSGGVRGGLDDPSARRRGAHLAAPGLDRAPVRASHAHLVNVSGLRGLGGLWLPPIAGAHRVWAWPGLTGLGPAARFAAQRGRRPQPGRERAGPSIRLGRRWGPDRTRVCVADSRVAARAWRARVARRPRVKVRTRPRRAAALSEPPPPRAPGQRGRPRLPGTRRPPREAVWAAAKTPGTTRTMAAGDGAGPREVEVAPDTAVWSHAGQPPGARRWGRRRDPPGRGPPPAWWAPHREPTDEQSLAWWVRRWSREVPWAAARGHLGLATPRQGPERAMARTTPARGSLSAVMTRTAHRLSAPGETWGRSTAWEGTTRPTVSDARAWGRQHWWEPLPCSRSQQETDMMQIPRA
jgi:hypothetical protein